MIPPTPELLYAPVVGDQLSSLSSYLGTSSLGRAHRHVDETDSTNDDAAAWLRDGGPSGLLVTADTQRRGRGRQGRVWDSSVGEDIYSSVGMRLSPAPASMGAVALAVGVGLARGLLRVAPDLDDRLRLKWPNDVLLDGKKLAGILCESRWMGSAVELVIGFGINVGRRRFGESLEELATSLALACPVAPDRVELLAEVLAALEEVTGRYFEGGFEAIREAYEPRCCTLGARVTVPVTRPDGSVHRIHATALSLDDDGALRVQSAGGGAPFRVDQADVWMAPEP